MWRTLTVVSSMAVFATCSLLCAQAVTDIRNTGDPANRVDLVVVAEGYTAAEQGKFATDVQNFVVRMFSEQPYTEYQNYYNVRSLFVASSQSGADHPELTPPVYVNTAFDATYNCAGIQRLTCVDTAKVLSAVSAALAPSQRDTILVLINDPVYGGSGGTLATSSVHPSGTEIVLHELGHSFGLLADEYDYGPPACNATFEPTEANATRATTLATTKWNFWIAAGTPIPTTAASTAVPGVYQGAKYCATGLYRPTWNSKMRSLGVPFEQINTSHAERTAYVYIRQSSPGQVSFDCCPFDRKARLAS